MQQRRLWVGGVSGVVIVLLAASAWLAVDPGRATSTEGPHSIRLLLAEDPAHGMTVAWGLPTATTQYVRYWRTPGAETTVQAVAHAFPDYWYKSDTTNLCHAAEAVGQIYVVRLTGLASDTQYFYKVGSDVTGWSTPDSFRTAGTGFVTFTAYGDNYPGASSAANAARAAMGNPQFHLEAGDISYAGTFKPTHETWWTDWFAEQAPLVEDAVIVPVLGNHDLEGCQSDDSRYTNEIFPYPPGNTASRVSFRWGDVAVVGVRSIDESKPLRAGELSFLSAELDRHQDARWRVVMMHAGPYGTGANHGSACDVREQTESLFAEKNVDLVISGHDHSYERTYPIRNGITVFPEIPNHTPKGSGTTYVIAGTGGPLTFYPFTNPPDDDCSGIELVQYSADREQQFAHVRVTESAAGLHVQTIETGGAVIDEFWIDG